MDPNFAQTIEFSTKFTETPLTKLILLTERLSVEIANLLPFICEEWRWIQLSTNILEKNMISPKYQIRNCRFEWQQCSFKFSLDFTDTQTKSWFSFQWIKTPFKWPLMPSRLPYKEVCKLCLTGKTLSATIRCLMTKTFSPHSDDNFAPIHLMLATMSSYVICHRRRRIRCPVRSQSSSVADVTSTNWTKRRFSEKLTVLIIVIRATIPVNTSLYQWNLSVFSWHCPLYPLLPTVHGFIFIVIVFHFRLLPPSSCRDIYLSIKVYIRLHIKRL